MSDLHEQQVIIKEEVESLLNQNKKIMVRFAKRNGEIRDLNCVISPEVVGKQYNYSNNSTQKISDDVKRVWDIDINEWRSFRWSDLIRFNEI